MPGFSDLLIDLDPQWGRAAASKIPIRIIGAAALMLQADYERGTKDGDVLETAELTQEVARRLRELAGPGSALSARHRTYFDLVAGGIPFLPQAPRWNPLADLNARLVHFEASALDVVDVVVSKLKRLSPSDLADIDAMVQLGLVPHVALVTRFRDAVSFYSMDARAEDLPRYVANLHRIERDIILTDESVIDLPSWI